MKKIVFVLATITITLLSNSNVHAQYYGDLFEPSNSNDTYCQQRQNASITFRNESDHSMQLKIVGLYGGLYQSISLFPHSSRTVYFSSSATYKLKIKTSLRGQTSYHDGGKFSVTCTATEWTEGEMSFKLSSYGNGLGPSISRKEFEND